MPRLLAVLTMACALLPFGAGTVSAGPVQLPGAPDAAVEQPPRIIYPAIRSRPLSPAKPALSPQEKARRKQLFSRAKAGDTEAMRALARAYEEGSLGLKKSHARAASWLRRAAQAGDAEAAYRLARMLLKGGEGVKRAPKIAAALFKAAAERGHVPSMHWLGYMLEFGIGVPRDLKAARAWYEKAAEKGHTPAHVALGLMALTGRGGERDFEAALDHFSKAAEKGDGWAMNNLGAMFEMGWGVPKDREKAIIYYELAKERKNPAGLRNLVRLGAVQMTPPTPENGHNATGTDEKGAAPDASTVDTAGEAATEAGVPATTKKEPRRRVSPGKRFNFRPGRAMVNTP